MAPKHGGGATIRGKQASIQEGQFLQFLRSVGYKDELPPSTVAWLEQAPIFRFLASKLSHDNFIAPEEEQEYNELMLARGPDASLYDAIDGLSSDVDSGSSSCTGSKQGQKQSGTFLGDPSDEEVVRMLEAEEALNQQLEQQVSALRAVTGELEAGARQQAESQGSKHFALSAAAADELSAAKLDAQQLSESLDTVLHGLESVCSELCNLAGQPHLWLLCAADQSGYQHTDDSINTQHVRGVQVLDVSAVALDLHHPATPAAANPLALAAAAKAGAGGLPPYTLGGLAAAGVGCSTPRGAAQQLGAMTPRQGGQGQALAEALAEAKTKRREAHVARNVAMTKEMLRQQHAFLMAYQADVAAGFREQGLKAQLAAVQQVHNQSGEFAAWLGKGSSSVQELQRQLQEAERTMVLLKETSLKPLIQEVAELNDCHIVVGDYDRHLAKVNYAMEHKKAMLDSLLQRASLHLVLLLLCVEELRRLSVLGGQLSGTAHILEGHIAVTEARVRRCAAAVEALDKAQSLGNVQLDDSYLCALAAAAEGNLVLQHQQQQQSARISDTATGGDPHTPHTERMGHSSLCEAVFTPSYAPSSGIADQLQGLSDSLDSSTEQLVKLLDLLPAQLEQHKASACRLHSTAFPPGQPLMSSGGPTGLAAAGLGATGVGSVGAASVSGSTRAGSVAASHSVRSEGSGVGFKHPQLLLTLPEVAEATAALDSCVRELMEDTNRVVTKHNEAAQAVLTNPDRQQQRQVLAKFFTAPEALAKEVAAVKSQINAMRLYQSLHGHMVDSP